MSDKKYRVKIVKVGIGDPLIAIAYQFIQAGSSGGDTYTDPTQDPISEIDLRINIIGGDVSNGIGHININTIDTNEEYVCMLPFDDSGYSDDQQYAATVHFDRSNCDFTFTAPDEGVIPSDWNFINEPSLDRFTIEMTSGFNANGLQSALADAGWISE